jgi:YD repeat-containing protein
MVAVAMGGTMANIWDRFGRLIGTVRDLGNGDANTYDENGQPLGQVRKTGTYEIRGNKISSERDPGLTFRKKK